MGHLRESVDNYPQLSAAIYSGIFGNKVHGDRLPWCVWKLKGGVESIPSVVLGFILLAVRACLDVFRDIGVHPGPPEVPPHMLNRLLMSEVSCNLAVVFGFEDGGDHGLGNVEASSVVENVVGFHLLVLLVLPSNSSDLRKKVLPPLDWGYGPD